MDTHTEAEMQGQVTPDRNQGSGGGPARAGLDRRRQRRYREHERGVALLLGTLALLSIVPLAGMAIDAGMAYIIKTRLSVAVDSACLAAARSLNRGLDLSSQEAAARSTAVRYFYANFGEGQFGTTGAAPVVLVEETSSRMRRVTVSAVRTAPLYFLPIIGKNYSDVGVLGQATRRDSNIILVLDCSSSMTSTNSVVPMKTAAKSFVERFSNGRDRLGLVVYHGPSLRAMEPTFFFKSASPNMNDMIDSIKAGGNTGTTAALHDAYDMLLDLNEAGALNVVVFFTDGLPNGIVGNFNNRNENGEPDLLLSSSTCADKNADKIGFLSQQGGGKLTGPTSGIFNWVGTSLTNTSQPQISGLDGCYMKANSSVSGDETRKMYLDVAQMPFMDLFGNRTTGFLGQYAVDLTEVDSPYHINKASMNTAMDQAKRMRSNAVLKPVIYAIGLGDESAAEPPDHEFMKKLANSTDSATYSPDEATGLYLFVQIADQEEGLQEAFQRVAGEIIRLSL